MRIASGFVGVAVMAALLVGCSSHNSSSDDSAPAPSPRPAKVSPLGPFFGECGNVTDDEVAKAMGQPPFPTVFRNSVGCVWQVDAGLSSPTASFSWYRGSPIGREATGSGLIGRPPEKIDVQGHPGFRGSLSQELCEIGVQYGDDFFHWSISYGLQSASVDPCTAAMNLANLTASRVK